MLRAAHRLPDKLTILFELHQHRRIRSHFLKSNTYIANINVTQIMVCKQRVEVAYNR